VTSRASAQELDAPHASDQTGTHRFFDATNIMLTGIEVGAMLADGVTTQHVLQADPTHQFSREANPIARPFVYAGWPGQIAGGALFVSAEVGLRYWLHRTNHHRLERCLPILLAANAAVGAIHNATLWGAADALRQSPGPAVLRAR
jgi:hypothetical protein